MIINRFGAPALVSIAVLSMPVSGSAVPDADYPRATVRQATLQTVETLKDPDRLAGKSDDALEQEYSWTKDMAALCLRESQLSRQQRDYAIEFQRHAGRVARFRGLIGVALREYARAWDMTVELGQSGPGEFGTTVLHDFADTHFAAGAYDQSEAVHMLCNSN